MSSIPTFNTSSGDAAQQRAAAECLMKKILSDFETHIASIEGAMDELLPPVSADELVAAEQEIGITFPNDFRTLYQWHNGDKGTMFLFGEYRISPLSEILELYRLARKASSSKMERVSDESGVFKDCIYNAKWIQFADNGGNTVVLLDMDPGKRGLPGQLIEACDDETECRFSGVSEFITNINDRISTGKIFWDGESRSFFESNDDAFTERKHFSEKVKPIENSLDFESLLRINTGEEIDLVGAIKTNHKTKRHKLYIRNGSIQVVGDIGNLGGGLSHDPPLVKVRVRIGKKTLFGFGAPVFEVIYCERITQ